MVDLGGIVSGGKDLLDRGLDKIEGGVEAGKAVIGHGIDKGTEIVGEGLEKVGADDWADKVTDWGDDTASGLGAKVGEQQLGQTEEANELIHGKPDKIREIAGHLTDFHTAFDQVGRGMRTLDSNGWKGQSGNAFRAKLAMEPMKWLHAADACATVGGALVRYAETVVWAQDKAAEAIALHKKGQADSKKAVDAYNSKVDTYNAAALAGRDPGPEPPPFKVPGLADVRRAHEILGEARRQRNEAGAAVQKAIQKATEHAPAEPPASNRLASNAIDAYGALNIETLHVAGGVVKGV
ncbi:putative T7SS-secreted protein, partial [Streptomyces purpureus]|uniref:putative T7SS-secreted protein n=1 Tax=Streptomyces purpureus TaxID=1951 RepID=UPI0037BD1B4C